MTTHLRAPATPAPSIEELHAGGFEPLVTLRHAELVDFAAHYFLTKKSWWTRLHHAFSLATLAALAFAAWAIRPTLAQWFTQLMVALTGFVIVLLPLHEGLHALAYRMAGARQLRWNCTKRGLAVYVLAHREVVAARPFVFVALLPFCLINAALIAGALLVPQLATGFLIALLVHIGGSAGDWALLNFLLEHRHREVYTYDDGESGETFFFARITDEAPTRAGLPASVGTASLPLRVLVAAIWTIPAFIAAAGAFLVASHGVLPRVLATTLLMPLACIALVAAAYVLAPRSAFGDWLDLALPALRERWTAMAVVLLLLVTSALILGAESCGSWSSLRR